MGFFDAFQIYNKDKHAPGNYREHGAIHSNIGTGKTTYMQAREWHPSTGTAAQSANTQDTAAKRSSISSQSTSNSATAGTEAPHLVDISRMTREEFQTLYDQMQPGAMRKSEPNNRVNF